MAKGLEAAIDQHSAKTMVFIETSSYLPLIWTTPYSQSLVSLMAQHESNHEFFVHRDCIAEAAGYLSFEDNWRYHPSFRIRRLLQKLSDTQLKNLGFPSAAIQLLLGGNIWPQAQYLNFVRHTTFFFSDLVDGLCWANPRDALSTLAERIDRRVKSFRQTFKAHFSASVLNLPQNDILPYWGKWYLSRPFRNFTIHLVDDPRPYNKKAKKLRDIYHYDCALNHTPLPEMMIVANTGFKRNVKNSFSELRIPIVCAETASAEFFS